MNYNQIEKKYQNAGCINYKLRNREDLLNIIGLDVNEAQYFNDLSAENQELITNAIIEYLNGCGIGYRHGYRLKKAYLCQIKKLVVDDGIYGRRRIAFMTLNVNDIDNVIVDSLDVSEDYEELKDKGQWECVECNGKNTFLRMILMDKNDKREWFHVYIKDGEVEFY